MSAFICARCDNLRDADDGCDDAPLELGGGSPSWRLICIDCAGELEALAEDEAAHEASCMGRIF